MCVMNSFELNGSILHHKTTIATNDQNDTKHIFKKKQKKRQHSTSFKSNDTNIHTQLLAQINKHTHTRAHIRRF